MQIKRASFSSHRLRRLSLPPTIVRPTGTVALFRSLVVQSSRADSHSFKDTLFPDSSGSLSLQAPGPALIQFSDMAYHQQHDPYANAFPDYPSANNQAPNYAYPQQHAPQQQQRPQHDYSFDNQSSWDAKSTKSYQSSYAGSQAHLNPNSYDMHQVSVPPMPNLPYQAPAGN